MACVEAAPLKTTYRQASQLPCEKSGMNKLDQFDSNIQQTDNGRQSTTLSKMMHLQHSIGAINQSERLSQLKRMTYQEFKHQ